MVAKDSSIEVFAYVLLILALAGAVPANITFDISQDMVRIQLFGITLRRIALSDIEFADRTWCWWNEHYNTTLNPKRIIRLRRRSGIIRNLIITPKDPDAFLSELAEHGIPIR